MQGRETGTIGHLKSTAYIAAQVKAMGLEPAGDNGTYFQNLPVFQRSLDPNSALSVGGVRLAAFRDFVATPGRGGDPRSIDGAQVIFGGEQGDTVNELTADQVRGKLVIVTARPGGGGRGRGFGFRGRGRGGANPLAEAAGIATVETGEAWTAAVRAARPRPGNVIFKNPDAAPAPRNRREPDDQRARGAGAARRAGVAGHQGDGRQDGERQSALHGDAGAGAQRRRHPRAAPIRSCKGEYVAIGAHNDHIGMTRPAGRSRLAAHLQRSALRVPGMPTPREQATRGAEQAAVNIQLTSTASAQLRPARLDSISNGADDDGSGSVSVLEIAREVRVAQGHASRSGRCSSSGTSARRRGCSAPRTSPTTRRCRAIRSSRSSTWTWSAAATRRTYRVRRTAAIRGSPNYLQLVGSRRLSTELGDMVETGEHARTSTASRFDYSIDANGHPMNIYCRSDHYEYARYGIPIIFFTTGLHSRLPPGDRRAGVHRLRSHGARRAARGRRGGAGGEPRPSREGGRPRAGRPAPALREQRGAVDGRERRVLILRRSARTSGGAAAGRAWPAGSSRIQPGRGRSTGYFCGCRSSLTASSPPIGVEERQLHGRGGQRRVWRRCAVRGAWPRSARRSRRRPRGTRPRGPRSSSSPSAGRGCRGCRTARAHTPRSR